MSSMKIFSGYYYESLSGNTLVVVAHTWRTVDTTILSKLFIKWLHTENIWKEMEYHECQTNYEGGSKGVESNTALIPTTKCTREVSLLRIGWIMMNILLRKIFGTHTMK